MSADRPLLRLALPGSWAQVPLEDQVRVDRVVQLVGEAGAGLTEQEALRAALQLLAASGGDLLLLRQEPTAPTVLVTAWRPRADAGPLDAEVLRAELGLDGSADELPREDDHVLLREPRTAPGCAGGATYWVAAPGRHHVLSLTVFLHGAAAHAEEQAFYDGLAASVTWREDAGAAA